MASDRRLRIGILANTLDQHSGPDAGGHVHFLEVARRWQWADVFIFAPEAGRNAFTKRAPLATFVSMPDCDTFLPGKAAQFLARAVLGVWRISALRRCDAIVATSTGLPDVLPAAFCKRRHNVVTAHHVIVGAGRREGPRLRNAIAYAAEMLGLSISTRRFALVVTSSEMMAGQLRALGFRQPIVVTSNGVDHTPPPQVVHEPRSGAVFLGRMHPTKGVDDLILSWRRVVDVLPDQRLTLIGAADDEIFERRIADLIGSLGLSHAVERIGRVSEEEKHKRLASASVFTFPSKEEGWGIAVGEAMRAGLPCVTYDLPIFAEVFPSGRLCSTTGDVPALADNVIRILRDDALRERLAAEALALSKRFTWQRAADVEEAAIRKLIEA